MRIKTRMIASVVISSIFMVGLVGMLVASVAMSHRADLCVTRARNISNAVFDLALLTGDYTNAPGDRAAQQWSDRHASLGELLETTKECDPVIVELADTLRPEYEHLGRLFSELTTHTERAGNGDSSMSAYGIRVSDQMRISTQSLASNTLSFEGQLQADQSDARSRILALGVVVALASIALLTFFTWNNWRFVAGPLVSLRDGARALAAGDMDRRFGVTRDDEAGEVARAFDDMADALTDSHRALEAEVAERRSAEQHVREAKREVDQIVERRTVQLLETNRRLAEATQAKDRFMARMSHELRTPLNSIIGFSSVILSGAAGPLTEEQEKQLRMISRGGTRLLVLVNDLLDISVIASGGIDIECGDVDLEVVGDELARVIEPLAHGQGIDFNYENTASGTIFTDRARLEQIMMNLLSNALKFTNEGSVSLSIARTADGGACLAVSDTGIGIATERIDEIFDEFAQLAPPADRIVEGTGLGLAIVRSLTEILGGSVKARSVPGEGSTFTITLPSQAPFPRRPSASA